MLRLTTRNKVSLFKRGIEVVLEIAFKKTVFDFECRLWRNQHGCGVTATVSLGFFYVDFDLFFLGYSINDRD